MITVPDAARRAGRNPETVRRWIRAGRLPAWRLGTQLVIDEEDLRGLVGAANLRPASEAERSAVDIADVARRAGHRVGEAYAGYDSHAGDEEQSAALNGVPLDRRHRDRLDALAARIHLSPEVVAGSLLATALDERDPEAATITAILDAIPGAWEDAQRGLEEIRSGHGLPLDSL